MKKNASRFPAVTRSVDRMMVRISSPCAEAAAGGGETLDDWRHPRRPLRMRPLPPRLRRVDSRA